jgi:hypothetical protein
VQYDKRDDARELYGDSGFPQLALEHDQEDPHVVTAWQKFLFHPGGSPVLNMNVPSLTPLFKTPVLDAVFASECHESAVRVACNTQSLNLVDFPPTTRYS